MKILVTGGAGYIGSHTCVELLNSNHELVVVDNLINSSKESINRVEQITGKSLVLETVDLTDKVEIEHVFKTHNPEVVIHFAGLKAVGESVEKPLMYYHNNLVGTINLLQVMQELGVKNFIFSSSATVYGDSEDVPFNEESPTFAVNPYGQTKLMIEQMLDDLGRSDSDWKIIRLRYFNPVGAHKSGLIGEDPTGIPNNLFPFVSQVAVGKLPKLKVFGGDYPTPDGTCIRDYIHVVDLALGHLKALNYLSNTNGVATFNLGTGKGSSVLEVVKAFGEAVGRDVPYEIVERRQGDAAASYADASLANDKLNWQAERGLAEMCEDAWRWQSQNPNGYGD